MEYLKQYNQSHADEQRQYRESRKDMKKQYDKQYRKLHKKERDEYSKQYYQKHKDKIKRYIKEYSKARREQRNQYNRQYFELHVDRLKPHYKKYRESNRKNKKEYDMMRLYGINMNQFNALLKSQKNKCPICGSKINERTAYIDHSHLSQTVRGLLCNKCNLHLGYYEHMATYADKIKQYTNQHKYTSLYSFAGSSINNRYRKEILAEQNYKCAICECELAFKDSRLDHEHRTGVIRGVLCNSCNTELGHYEKVLKYKDIIDAYLQRGNQYRLEVFVK